jgi:sterol desaturase/sphingolipid hydroxylase (fatty acid hydroxylase superfamily)
VNQVPINRSSEPIRLFKSDFLEHFTHISPVAVALLWIPVVGVFLWRALVVWDGRASAASVMGGFLLGLFLWTLIEYGMHRFVFHFVPKGPRTERIFFLFHGVHHTQPQCKTRLVMPPAVSIPLAVVVCGMVYAAFAVGLGLRHWVDPLMAGILSGYLAYDLTHYATHHLGMRRGIFRYLKRHHMMHHCNTPEQRYGVSSPLWDVVFRTYPKE